MNWLPVMNPSKHLILKTFHGVCRANEGRRRLSARPLLATNPINIEMYARGSGRPTGQTPRPLPFFLKKKKNNKRSSETIKAGENGGALTPCGPSNSNNKSLAIGCYEMSNCNKPTAVHFSPTICRWKIKEANRRRLEQMDTESDCFMAASVDMLRPHRRQTSLLLLHLEDLDSWDASTVNCVVPLKVLYQIARDLNKRFYLICWF